MNRQQHLDRLDLNDHTAFDHKIGPKRGTQAQQFIVPRYDDQTIASESALRQLVRQDLFVN